MVVSLRPSYFLLDEGMSEDFVDGDSLGRVKHEAAVNHVPELVNLTLLVIG